MDSIRMLKRLKKNTPSIIEQLQRLKQLTEKRKPIRREAYWTWDAIDSWSKHSKKIIFVGTEFDYGMIDFPSANYIDTIKESSKIRYVYYGSPTQCVGTLYAKLGNNTFSDSRFYRGMTIDETVDFLESNAGLIVFWIFWVILIISSVIGFYYIDNTWLEDRRRTY